MSRVKAVVLSCTFGMLLGAILGSIWITPTADAQKKDPVVRPRPAVKPEQRETPKEGELYIWSLPDKGLQTVLVLKVIDAESFEGAYLVPTRFFLSGVDGKAPGAADKIDKLIGGRLVNASMSGRDASGRVVVDVHFGEQRKGEPNTPFGWLSDWLKKK